MVHQRSGQSPLTESLDRDAISQQLDRILATPLFQHSKRYPAFLRYIVERAVEGTRDELKERTLGIAVFRRAPDYDTTADPVVRNTASEVRKRLEEYYSEPTRVSEVRISLPVGGYVPEFQRPATAMPLTSAGTKTGASRSLPFRREIVVGSCILAGLAVFGAIWITPRPRAIKVFWAPIFKTSAPVLVVTDTLVTLRNKSQLDSADNSLSVRDAIDPGTYVDLIQDSVKLIDFLGANGRRVEYQLARNVTLATLRTRPFILQGAFNNQWTQRAVASFRFYLQLDHDPIVRRIVDRRNPDRRDWSAPMGSGLTEDYALIARAAEPESGQTMLVIAGLSEKGSAAALEFVTNPKYLDRFAATAPRGWEKRNVELVIKSDIVNGEWGEPRVLAVEIW